MAIALGWRRHDVRRSYWHLDPAFLDPADPAKIAAAEAELAQIAAAHTSGSAADLRIVATAELAAEAAAAPVSRIAHQAFEAWLDDGDGSHLEPFARPDVQPSPITFRALRPDEARFIRNQTRRIYATVDIAVSASVEIAADAANAKAQMLCCRIGMDMPNLPAQIEDAGGVRRDTRTTAHGMTMLADGVISWLDAEWPGLTEFYGRKIWQASFASDAEKKASSRQHGSTTSSGETAAISSTEAPGAKTAPEPAA